MARSKTNKVHWDDQGKKHEVSKQKGEDRYFIKNTDVEVTGKVSLPNTGRGNKRSNYNFQRPSDAQHLGDEWDDYAWSADDF